MLEITAQTEDDTLALGRLLGELARPGDVFGLSGPLGAGKTVLTRGLAEGLGCDPERVRSPTFTLMVSYDGGRLLLHHLDLYRLEATEDDRLALREVLFGGAVSAIEWFERLGEEMEHLEVHLSMEPSDVTQPSDVGDSPAYARRIRLRACGDGYAPLVEAVRSRWR